MESVELEDLTTPQPSQSSSSQGTETQNAPTYSLHPPAPSGSSQESGLETTSQKSPDQHSATGSNTEVSEKEKQKDWETAFKKAEENDWTAVSELLHKCVQNSTDVEEFMTKTVTKEAKGKKSKNILQLACSQEKKLAACEAAKNVVDHARRATVEKPEILKAFLDGNDKENTPLHIAIDNENTEIVRYLIRWGADVNLPKPGHEREIIRLIHQEMPWIGLEQYRKKGNIKLTREMKDDHDSYLIVDWDFTAITGVLKQYTPESSEQESKKGNKVAGQNNSCSPHETGSNCKKEAGNKDIEKGIAQAGAKISKNFLKTPEEIYFEKLESQTALLGHVLRIQTNEPEVLRTPLIRLFMHFKCEKFKTLIRISMIWHVVWYIMTVLFAMSYILFLDSKLFSGNSTTGNYTDEVEVELSPENDTDTNVIDDCKLNRLAWPTAHWVYTGFYCFIFLIMLSKEILEMFTCPNFCYYWKQLENIGQLLLLGLAAAVGILEIIIQNRDCPANSEYTSLGLNVVCAALILISCLLVMGQINKTEKLGLYVEMSRTVLSRAFLLHVTYLPIFFAFYLIFCLYMSGKEQFGLWGTIPSMFTMMAGEVNYKDSFYPDKPDASDLAITQPYKTMLQIVFLLFVVIVMMIIANLMIALFIGDVQELTKTAIEDHHKKTLEMVCILESFLLSKVMKWTFKNCKWYRSWMNDLMVDRKSKYDPNSIKTKTKKEPVKLWRMCYRNWMSRKSSDEENVADKSQSNQSTNESEPLITSNVTSSNTEKKTKPVKLKELPFDIQRLILAAVKEKEIQVVTLGEEEY